MQSAAKPSKYQRMRLMQDAKQWDIDTDLPWTSLDASRPLLPDAGAIASLLKLTPAEELAFSQLLGLMAVQAISEHEKILGVVKNQCWEGPLSGLGGGDDLTDLGEQFFKDEAKHSRAFARYVDAFAAQRGIELDDLKEILPAYGKHSLMTQLFRLNCLVGGRAIWWLVMITEEESLALFRQLKNAQTSVDPLFFDLNRQHYEEELRHMSYAPLMLRQLAAAASPARQQFMRFDYLTAETLHVLWVLRQVLRLPRLKQLAPSHEFFATLAGIVAKFESLPVKRRVDLLLKHIPYVSEAMNPQRHRSIRVEVSRNAERAADLVQKVLGWARKSLGVA